MNQKPTNATRNFQPCPFKYLNLSITLSLAHISSIGRLTGGAWSKKKAKNSHKLVECFDLSHDMYNETLFLQKKGQNSKKLLNTGWETTLGPPLHSLNYKHIRKSTHIASNDNQCGTPVPNFMNLSWYLIPENYFSNRCVWNLKIR